MFVYGDDMTAKHPIVEKAIGAVTPATQAGLASAVGTSQALVGYWLRKSKRGVPAEWVSKVEAATGIPAHELRPDLFKPVPAQPVSEAARA